MFSLALGAAAPGLAQAITPPGPRLPFDAPKAPVPAAVRPTQDAPLPPVTVREYSEAVSRTAFAAIDEHADDRISIFEWLHAQVESVKSRDTELFRLMDADQNGFATWPEFDDRLRSALRVTGEFRYRPARAVKPRMEPKVATAPTRARGAVTVLLEMADADRSTGLSRDEYASLLAASGLPSSNGVHFIEADRNRSGELDEREIAVLLTLVPDLARRVEAAPAAKGLPAPWARADRDGDSEISVAEMASALRRIDPFLGRWAARVMSDAERTGNRQLGPAEVLAGEGAPPPTKR